MLRGGGRVPQRATCHGNNETWENPRRAPSQGSTKHRIVLCTASARSLCLLLAIVALLAQIPSIVAGSRLPVPPCSVTGPQSVTVTQGNDAVFNCSSYGFPTPNITWQLNGSDIPVRANILLSNCTNESTSVPPTWTSTLTVPNVTFDERGEYSCTGVVNKTRFVDGSGSGSGGSGSGGPESGGLESTATATATLTVNVPPRIVTGPQSVTVTEGSDAVFNCSSYGFPTPDITWQLNGGDIPVRANVSLPTSTSESTSMPPTLTSTLIVPNVTFDARGAYSCTSTVNNTGFVDCSALEGTATATALLTVNGRDCGAPPVAGDNSVAVVLGTLYMDTVTYRCHQGYHLSVGEIEMNLTCTENGTWRPNTAPTCAPLNCSAPSVSNDNVKFAISQFSVNSYVALTCEPGYVLHGYQQWVCSTEQTWEAIATYIVDASSSTNADTTETPINASSSASTRCHRVKCPLPPDGINSYVPDSASVQYNFEDNVTYVCQEGYRDKSNSTRNRTCGVSGTWTGQALECEVVTCFVNHTAPPDMNSHFVSRAPLLNFTQRAFYACNRGYFHTGTEDSILEQECMADGKLSPIVGSCQPQECSITSIMNSNISSSHVVKVHDPPTVIQCADGYVIEGSISTTNQSLRCQASINTNRSGVWSSRPTNKCIRISCGTPYPAPAGASVLSTTGENFEDEVTYSCDTGLGNVTRNETVTCQSGGTWPMPMLVCLPSACPTIVLSENVMAMPNLPSSVVGSEVSLVCPEGYILHGYNRWRCTEKKMWNSTLGSFTNGSVFVNSIPSPAPSEVDSQDTLCLRIKCPPPPFGMNSFVPESASVQYNFEDNVTYVCQEGYREQSGRTSSRTCGASGAWTGQALECEVVTCFVNDTAPPDMNSHFVSGDMLLNFTQRAFYACNRGYFHTGTEDSILEQECMADGKLSPIVGSCQPQECNITSIMNSNISSSRVVKVHDPPTVIQCADGYVIEGSISTTNQSLRCQASINTNRFGVWSSRPTNKCIRISCGTPYPAPAGASVMSTTGENFEDEVTYSCDTGLGNVTRNETVTCQSGGTWPMPMLVCLPSECPTIPLSANVMASPKLLSSVVGSEVSLVCPEGYILHGYNRWQCTEEKMWNSTLGSFTNGSVLVNSIPSPAPSEVDSQDTLCLRIKCPPPPFGMNSFVPESASVQYNFEDNVTYVCQEGYRELSGRTSSRTCGASGAWTGQALECEVVTCFVNDTAPPDMNSHFVSGDMLLNFTQRAFYACNRGYFHTGTEDSILEQECMADGKLSLIVGSCQSQECNITSIMNSNINSSRVVKVHDPPAVIQCDDGYVIEGSISTTTQSLRCQASINTNRSGVWSSQPTKKCIKISCGTPYPAPPGASMMPPTGENFEDNVTYSCDEGLGSVTRNETVTCQRDGTWPMPMLVCLPSACLTIVLSANVSASPNISSSVVGSEVSLVCPKGYILHGYNRWRCTEEKMWNSAPGSFTDGGIFVKSIPSPAPSKVNSKETVCRRIKCPPPPVGINSFVDVSAGQYEFEDTVMYVCQKGYRIKSGSTRTRQCGASGAWAGQALECEVQTCNVSSTPPYNNSRQVGAVSVLEYRQRVYYTCERGYYYTGTDTSILMQECLDDGNLSMPTGQCKAQACDLLAVGNSNMIANTNSTVQDIPVTINCHTGYVIEGSASNTSQTLSCEASINTDSFGVWSSPPVRRCVRINCGGPPPPPDNSIISFTSTFYGDAVIYTCNNGYGAPSQSSETLTCLSNGDWKAQSLMCPVQTCNVSSTPPYNNSQQVGAVSVLEYRQRVYYTCERGYYYTGTDTSILMQECLDDGNLSMPTGQCEAQACDLLAVGNSDMIANANSTVQDIPVTINCLTGYVIEGSANTTSQTLSCEASINTNSSGVWSSPPVRSCVRINCGRPPAPPENATISFTNTSYEDTVIYTCKNGYGAPSQSSETLTCLSNGDWEGQTLMCPVQTCNVSSTPPYNNSQQVGAVSVLEYRQRVYYTCKRGYYYTGTDTSILMQECLDDGNLSMPTGQCKAQACDLLAVSNSDKTANTNSTVQDIPVTINCDSGYVIEGSASNTSQTLSCEASINTDSFGVWSSPPVRRCVRINCGGPPVPPANATVSFNDTFYQNTVNYTCNNGYGTPPRSSETLTCLSNGTWTAPSLMCPAATCPTNPPSFSRRVSPSSQLTYRQRVYYACETGYYYASGASDILMQECQESGGLSMLIGECKEQMCTLLEVPNSNITGVVKASASSLGSVTITCNTGYVLEGTTNTTTTTIMCTANVSTAMAGVWDTVPPSRCIRINCGGPPVPPANATVSFNDTFYQNTVNYTCNNGYGTSPRSSETLTCLSNGTWTAQSLMCPVQTCNVSSTPPYNNSQQVGAVSVLEYRQRVYYTCERGYYYTGTDTSILMQECLDDGNLSMPTGQCKAQACDLLAVSNSDKTANTNSTVQDIPVTINCDSGYVIEGSASNTSQTLSCEASINTDSFGVWSSPPVRRCVRINCGRPPAPPANATISFTDTFYQNTATYTCNDGYGTSPGSSEALTCLSNGTWTAQSLMCRAATCPPNLPSFSRRVSPSPPVTYRQRVYYACETGYYYASGASDILVQECQQGGTLSMLNGECKEQMCTLLEVPNSNITGVVKASASNLESVTITCNTGYVLEGTTNTTTTTIMCTANVSTAMAGVWDTVPPSRCIRINCGGPPVPPANATVSFNDTFYQNTVNYTCNNGYGTSPRSSETLTCLSNGTWTAQSLMCPVQTCNVSSTPPYNNSQQVGAVSVLEYRQRVYYTCKRGYYYTGTDTSILMQECLDDGNLSMPTGQCKAQACDLLAVSNSDKTANTNSTVQDIPVTINCDSGYVIEGSAGNTSQTLSCEASINTDSFGVWSSPPVRSCVRINCGRPPAPPENATVSFTNTSYQDTVIYTCNNGYGAPSQSSEKLTCLSNGTWTAQSLMCPVQTCNVSSTPPYNNSRQVGAVSVLEYRQRVYYTCERGYYYSGTDTSILMQECLDDGNLSMPTGQCKAQACDLLAVSNSDKTANTNSTVQDIPVTINCDSGYVIEGSASNTSQTLSCEASINTDSFGVWSSPPVRRCVKINCGGPPVPPANATISFTDTFYQNTATYTCNDGYGTSPGSRETITCLSNGTWTAQSLMCRAATCPPHLPSFSRRVSPSPPVTYRQRVYYACETGYYYASGASDILVQECQQGGTLSMLNGECKEQMCTLLEVPNSNITGVVKASASNLESVTITCNTGYVLEGTTNTTTTTIMCTANVSTAMAGVWDTVPPSRCIRIDCGMFPLVPDNAIHVNQTGSSYNDNVTFQCLPGHSHNDSVSNQMLTCQADGTWQQPTLTCSAGYCNFVTDNSSLHVGDKTSYNVHDTITFVCRENEGYTRMNASNTLVATCQPDGTFTPRNSLQCERRTCEYNRTIQNGKILKNETLFVNETITYKCDPGFHDPTTGSNVGSLKCAVNGELNRPLPSCVDTDECLEKMHDCNFQCQNTIGFYRCICRANQDNSDMCTCRNSSDCVGAARCNAEKCECSEDQDLTYNPTDNQCISFEGFPNAQEKKPDLGPSLGGVVGLLAVICLILIILIIVLYRKKNKLKKEEADRAFVGVNMGAHDGEKKRRSGRNQDIPAIQADDAASDATTTFGGATSTPMQLRRIVDDAGTPEKAATNSLAPQSQPPPKAKKPKVLPTSRMDISGLTHIVQDPETLIQQFKSIPTNLCTSDQIPPGTETKNRYTNVLPNPHTRVPLRLKFNEPNSDYINGNYIRGYGGAAKKYIATQGPMYSTIHDFWRMVWEQKVSVILMVTGQEERGVTKCAKYWPMDENDNLGIYEDTEVMLKEKTTKQDYVVSKLWVTNVQKGETREIQHWWFTSWPDFGVPASPKALLVYLTKVKNAMRVSEGPVAVHCSAGIGRTGTVIVLDICMQELEHDRHCDVYKNFAMVRQDRGGMVQTKDQYKFIYQASLEYGHYLSTISEQKSQKMRKEGK